MFQLFLALASVACMLLHSFAFGGCCGGRCCQSVDVEVGWRRDNLKWKAEDLRSSCVKGKVNDRFDFDNINSYTLSGQAKWVGSSYYVRCSAEYGLTDKGDAHQKFNIRSPELIHDICLSRSDPIKRRSEVYDFDGALGYPFLFFCNRLSVIPLVGFSFHRQYLRIKHEDHYSSYCCSFPQNCCNFFHCHSSDSFFVEDENRFVGNPSKNPFSSCSPSSGIASHLGLCNPHRTDSYRFTWYGIYLGADISLALDNCWTLFWDTEFHFYDNCDRKRKTYTGIHFIDNYSKKGRAYGFNNIVGFNYHLCNCWYTTASVEIDWWNTFNSKHDSVNWQKIGAKIGLIYSF